MGRAAGDGSHYTWVLRNLSTGRYDQSSTIALPSVTTIIGRVLAKPMLVGWAYRQTRDAIAGLVSVHLQADEAHPDVHGDLLEVLGDADQLEQYLKENRLRPEDQTRDAQDRGKIAHGALERLAEVALQDDDATADAMASRMLEKANTTPFDKATASWWVDRQPSVVASEVVLTSLRHGFAGSVDLIWRNDEGALTVTDLKSRREGLSSYESDHIQTGAYSVAWEEMNPGVTVDRETVLVVRSDGTWDEYDSPLDNRAVFLDLLSVYEKLQRR